MPDLTRETLAELRGLQALEAATHEAFRKAIAAGATCPWTPEVAALETAWFNVLDDLRRVISANLPALLAAAERGLDVEGGR